MNKEGGEGSEGKKKKSDKKDGSLTRREHLLHFITHSYNLEQPFAGGDEWNGEGANLDSCF